MLDLANFRFDTRLPFIGGAQVDASTKELIETSNPSTGETLYALPRCGSADIDQAVSAATAASVGEWGQATATERGRVLTRIGRLVTERVDELARLEAMDVGKPLSQARADAVALARYMEFYGGAADKLHGQTIPYLSGYFVGTIREPFGVTGHVIPWNYPMQIIGRSIGAALAAGNATVLKPSEDACLTALAFAEIAAEAGLPDGALNVVPGLGDEAGAALARHPGVGHLSFTGSVEVGRSIQENAARNVVPVTLELGGKSPQIVFADADLDRALPFLINAGIQNAGQTCSATSRILVEASILEEVADRMARRYRELRAGPALDDLDLGPLVSRRHHGMVRAHLDRSSDLHEIARGVIVDEAPKGGHYVEPVLLACADGRHVLAQEEIFGPVQLVIPFRDEEHAVEIANGTAYGLVAGVWTGDGGRQLRLARRLRAGQVFINNFGAGGGVELPFGGTGLSGHGREKGFEALYGMTRLKTVASFHG